jgi:hypothetical protein
MKFYFALLAVLIFGASGRAAVRTWTGAGANSNWSTAANWVGNVAPVAGDDLVFPANASQQTNNNNLLLFTQFNSIRFEGGAYNVGGNPFVLGAGGLTVETGTQTINVFNVRLNAAQTFTANQANATVTLVSLTTNNNLLTFDGAGQFGIGLISGSGGLLKKGFGITLLLSGGVSGTVTVENGILVVDGNSSSQVNVTGGALGGNGTVGAVNVTSGGVSAGTLQSPTGTLNIQGNLTVGAAGAVIIKLAGSAAGQYDQLSVNGTINLTDSRLVPVPLNNFNPAINDVYTIIKNNGSNPVIGTFAGIAEGGVFAPSNNLAFRVSYAGGASGRDVTLTRIAYAPFDFDGDGKTDTTVFRPSNAFWYIANSGNSSFRSLQFGVSDDKIVPADYDGDGKTDVAVFRPSNGAWYILRSSDNAFQSISFGVAEDIPVPADYDGDGRRDIAVFRPSTGVWYELRSATNQFYAEQFGQTGDVPVPADFDGDTLANIAVFRPSNGVWYIHEGVLNGGGVQTIQFGLANDKPVLADFDNDGKTDIVVYRNAAQSFFYVLRSSDNAFQATQWGTNGDVPTVGDYDGDGKPDFSVFRPATGTWYSLLSSNNGFRTVQWGTNGDKPVPAAFVR